LDFSEKGVVIVFEFTEFEEVEAGVGSLVGVEIYNNITKRSHQQD